MVARCGPFATASKTLSRRARGERYDGRNSVGRRPLEHLAAPLESHEHVRQFGERVRPAVGVEHDDVGGVADGDAVVFQVHQPRRQVGHEVEAGLEFVDAGLRHIGVEIGHPQQRRVAERREGIEHIVGGDRTQHAMSDQSVRQGEAARRIMGGATAHQIEIGCRQHGDGDAGVGEPIGGGLQSFRRERGQLGGVADRDPAVIVAPFGLPAHFVHVVP